MVLCVALATGCGDDDPGMEIDVDAATMSDGGADGGGADGGSDAAPPDLGVDAFDPTMADMDADGISDADEGYVDGTDTDGDGTPDHLDTDSDGDGIADADEAGDDDPATSPIDSDADGTPDFQDTDSDDNGILDGDEGTEDFDLDGVADFADLDDDADGLADVVELAGTPDTPPDADGDGMPDFRDIDSDGDTIADADEGLTDPDGDEVPSYVDLDSDDDCIADALEAGDDDPATTPSDADGDGTPDYLDLDSDGDGLTDNEEDVSCDGVLDASETSAYDPDSDGDGADDFLEGAAGTDPRDAAANPAASGDFVFEVPFEDTPLPADDALAFTPSLRKLDVYTLVDRSGSMTDENASIRASLDSVAARVTCAPLGTGTAPDCIEDIWWGAGTVGYRGTNGQAYTNHLDLQPNPALVRSSLPSAEPGGCCDEPLLLGTYSTLTGANSSGDGTCTVSTPYPPRTSCDASPAGAAGLGYPCFRDDSLPVIMLVTDEPPTATYNCPTTPAVVAQANAMGAKIIGIRGSTVNAQVTTDLQALASGTGALDSAGVPIVVDGANAMAASAIETAIRDLANGVTLDLSLLATDDPADAVDAVATFLAPTETLQLGTAECSDGLTDVDTDTDGIADAYVDVRVRTPVCWRLAPQMNTTVAATSVPQIFRVTVQVIGDGITVVDERDIFFVVPAAP
ncbi:MAG: hypothetical protein CMN30_22355 [Sandaracinus sp.]|nr:hypothetical protein [Sandaracinus sp.]